MTVALQSPSKSGGLVNIGFGYFVAALLIDEFVLLDLESKLLLIGFLGGIVGSALVILDPIKPFLDLIIRVSPSGDIDQYTSPELLRRHRMRMQAGMPVQNLGHKSFKKKEEELKQISSGKSWKLSFLSSPYIMLSYSRIKSALYLGFAIALSSSFGRFEGMIPYSSIIIPSIILALIIRAAFDILDLNSKLIILDSFNEVIYCKEQTESGEIEKIQESLNRRDWGTAKAWIMVVVSRLPEVVEKKH